MEPTTPRSRVTHATDWASQVSLGTHIFLLQFYLSCFLFKQIVSPLRAETTFHLSVPWAQCWHIDSYLINLSYDWLNEFCSLELFFFFFFKNSIRGARVAQSFKRLPLAQVMIPGSRDWAPCQDPCSAGSLLVPLPLPATPHPTCALSLCQMNK